MIDKVTKEIKKELDSIIIFPAKHYIVDENSQRRALVSIKKELEEWLPNLPSELERQRLLSRTNYDLEMLSELGYCSGIENYSRHFDGRKARSTCLLPFRFF